MFLHRFQHAVLVAVGLWTLPRSTRAQDAGTQPIAPLDAASGMSDVGSAEGGSPSVATPPELLGIPPAIHPEEADDAGVEGVVSLRLTIDVEGRVTEIDVLTPVGRGLDVAARSAASRFRFAPARRDGQPVVARVRYDYVWTLPAAVSAVPLVVEPPSNPVPSPPARAASHDASVEGKAQDVAVRGKGVARRLRESAEAVTVVETKLAQRESADLGEVLARTEGISIRRAGGLGSGARFSLNGLTDDQIRFFLDGVPLQVAGFGLGLQNVPVNLVERVEVYRGVVPIRFGADALGGAVNLVSPEDLRGTHAAGSVQLGSFGTQRITLAARHTHAPSGFYAGLNAFVDHADNDYPIDVEVPDEKGRLSAARAYRFHDAYSAYGGGAEIGFVDRPWAKRLVLRAYGTRQDKELQHNLVMTVPYGEASYWEAVRGVSLRYEQPRIGGGAFGVSAVGAFSRRVINFEDLSPYVYDWFGRHIRDRVRPGEIGDPSDERFRYHTALARTQLSYALAHDHTLRAALAPTFVTGSGRDALVTAGRDPLSAERNYFALTSGVEYQADLFERRLESVAFAKSYLYKVSTEEPLPGGFFRKLDQDSHTMGFGERLRFRLTEFLWAKISYERATRLPSTDEVFGNGVLVLPNLRIVPERSHNGNLGLTVDLRETTAGAFRSEINVFVRHAQNLIVLLGNDQVFTYQNVYTARSQGVEASGGWTSPEEYVSVDGNVTWQSLRNVSDEGTFKDFDGDRIPNRPYVFANLSARLRKAKVSSENDELSLAYYLRYVHEFFRGWESLGLREFKQTVPSQTTHSVALTYLARGAVTQTWSAEIQNVTDVKTYDFFGVQRPGRAFYVKLTVEY